MARPVGRDASGNFYTTDPQTGAWRQMTEDERGNMSPVGVLDEMHAGAGAARFRIKNLNMAPGAALALLKQAGFEAVPYGDGLNFALRKPGEAQWRLLDPEKFDSPGELWRDLTDLLGDAAVGTATGLGTLAGAGLGSIATGALAGGAAEAARQALGGMENIQPGQIALSAAGGAIAPPLGAAAGAVLKAPAKALARFTAPKGLAHRVGEAVASKIGGVRPLESVDVSDILSETAARHGQAVINAPDVVQIYQRHMDEVAEKVIGRITRQRDNAVGGAQPVNILPFLEKLDAHLDILQPSTKFRALEPRKAALQDAFVRLLNKPSLTQVAQAAGPDATPAQITQAYNQALARWRTQLRAVPARVAFRAKKVLQDEAFAAGRVTSSTATPGAMQPVSDSEVRAMRRFVSDFTESLHKQLPANIRAMDAKLASKVQAREAFRKQFGVNPNNVRGPEMAVLRAFEKGGKGLRDVIRAYQSEFPGVQFERIAQSIAGGRAVPTNAFRAARDAAIGSRFTPISGALEDFGKPSPIARIAATGQFLGTTLLPGALGAAALGPVGGLAAAASGPFLFSPAMLVKMAPHAAKLNAVVNRMASGVEKAELTGFLRKAAGVMKAQAAQETGRRVTSQDERGRRRTLFIGR